VSSLIPTAPRTPAQPDVRDRAAAVQRVSAGSVVGISPSGPVLRMPRTPQRAYRPETFVRALRHRDRILVAGLSVGWLAGVVLFWWWWLRPEHWAGGVGFVFASTLMLYLSVEPLSYVVAANRLRRIDQRLPVPELRVAFVVTRAPSEAWAVAKRTLSAMLQQDFPHHYDIWLCDEQPDAEITEWCAAHGVRISTRFGADAYHHDDWPRRTRCKEGNLAYFYDHMGYSNYDVVAQLDCDHVPARSYLAGMVRPFGDPAVGYVAAPSICDLNAGSSWAARGRLHREAYFHGAIQLGHNAGLAPICIGSHYAVRTDAIAEIGGIGPELLEDFSTSFLLNSAGWQGAFATDAEAHGNGPLTLSAMVVQEFQWTRSLATLLCRVVPSHLGRLHWRLRLRYLYALLYHTALVVAIGCGLAAAVGTALAGPQWIGADPVRVLLYWLAISLWLVALTAVLRRRGLLRPADVPILSWDSWLYRLTRWPFIAWGVCTAAVQLLRPRPITFKVTPKTPDGLEPLPATVVAPFAVISVLLAGTALIGESSTGSGVLVCLLGAVIYAAVTFTVCGLHAAEVAKATSVNLGRAISTVVHPLFVATLTVPLVVLAMARYL
jgi:cellulose synthase (UDP-forming)